eukprot:8134915-Alexandrium_andersonii.AAC.1
MVREVLELARGILHGEVQELHRRPEPPSSRSLAIRGGLRGRPKHCAGRAGICAASRSSAAQARATVPTSELAAPAP